MGWYGDDYGYKPYVPVAQRRAQALKEVARRIKKGEAISPVVIEGRTIAATFWGKAWCDNLELYSDYASRLPKGRTYARNGSIVHLEIGSGRIKALVSGSSLYNVQIDITPLAPTAWQALKARCVGQVSSIVELLQGKLSAAVMATVTDRDQGLFPKPKEIKMACSCPDGAEMCKHVAAVMYGVGHRLDTKPDLLFQLRSVNPAELIDQAIPAAAPRTRGKVPQIATADLGAIFGIELDYTPTPPPSPQAKSAPQPAKIPRAKPVAPPRPTPPARKVPVAAKPVGARSRPAPVVAEPVAPPRPTPPAKPAPVVAKPPVALPALKALIASNRPAPFTQAKAADTAALPKPVARSKKPRQARSK